MKLSHIPLRLSTGALILNSGAGKIDLDPESAAGLQAMAGQVFPQLERMEPEKFGKYLGYAEMAVGGLLLAPFIPSRLAGLALAGFAGPMVALYLKTPGMTQPDGIRPTQEGTALAKDVWMLGIALALLLDTRGRKPARLH
ncbi:DoxX family membrane protein [Arthrobacter deserti]|uniref:DoxX family membrane protein n=1 Tax=Arthrobacter deserti TaxID=1742687 RepID=A0ABX1JMB0_9MICC|nr:DoxX family membrane protein [Arthrobacter deserti]